MQDRDDPLEFPAVESRSFAFPDAEFITAACLGGALSLVAGDLRLAISSEAPGRGSGSGTLGDPGGRA